MPQEKLTLKEIETAIEEKKDFLVTEMAKLGEVFEPINEELASQVHKVSGEIIELFKQKKQLEEGHKVILEPVDEKLIPVMVELLGKLGKSADEIRSNFDECFISACHMAQDRKDLIKTFDKLVEERWLFYSSATK